eukprot:15267538-Alexandrium_andersonii.AAC.1
MSEDAFTDDWGRRDAPPRSVRVLSPMARRRFGGGSARRTCGSMGYWPECLSTIAKVPTPDEG